MIAVDLSGLDAAPCYDPVSHLVHAVGREASPTSGSPGGASSPSARSSTADEASIVARARLWQERLQ